MWFLCQAAGRPKKVIDILITDWDAAEIDLIAFEEKGIDVIIVEKEEKEGESGKNPQ